MISSGRRCPGGATLHSSPFSPTASKGSGLGTICLWSWRQTWGGRGSQSTVAVVVLARLQWSPTELAYFSLSACPGEPACLPHPLRASGSSAPTQAPPLS